MFDIANSDYICQKISLLCDPENKEREEFYKNNYVCKHCGQCYDKESAKCSSCGAPKEND